MTIAYVTLNFGERREGATYFVRDIRFGAHSNLAYRASATYHASNKVEHNVGLLKN